MEHRHPRRIALAILLVPLALVLAACPSTPTARVDAAFAALFTTPKNSDPNTIMTVMKGKFDRVADKEAVSRAIVDGFVYCDTSGLGGSFVAVGVGYTDGTGQLFWVSRGYLRDFLDKRISPEKFVEYIQVDSFSLE